MKALRVIERIDRAICRLYALRREHRARHFVTAGALTGELLVRQKDDELELAIQLPAPVLDALGAPGVVGNPASALGALSVAVEEVSHFRYLVERATRDRGVSALELEIQGEIDRFAVLYFWMLRDRRFDAGLFRELEARCFGEFRPSRALSAVEDSRYREAHAFAARFVAGLRELADVRHVLERLRAFYRSPLSDKAKFGTQTKSTR